MKRSYKHFFFDFDGVICDSLATAVEAFNAIRDTEYPQLPRISNPSEDMTIVYAGSLRTCLLPWLSEEDARRFFDLHSSRMAQLAPDLNIFSGVGAVLSLLNPKKCSIVTSAYSQAVQAILGKDAGFDADCLFKIAGRELRQTKTDKIRAILNELKLGAEDAVYVGDLESDILYCRDVPMDIISVSYGYHPRHYLARQRPDYLVGSVEELGALINQLNRGDKNEDFT
jgi:phosphoglycolate phosphatase-like HAD superfamily hydrolase